MDYQTKLEQFSSFLRLFKKLPSDIIKSNILQINIELGYFSKTLDENVEGIVEKAIENTIPQVQSFRDTFWKSFNDVALKSQEELWTHAMIHYFTTYGLESMGIDSDGFVYLPEHITKKNPQLEKVLYIDEISTYDAQESVKEILFSNTGLSIKTIEDCFNVLDYLYVSDKTILSLLETPNKEVKTRLYLHYNITPDDGEELIRLINYILTNDTCLIKNQDTIIKWRFACQHKMNKDSEYFSNLVNNKQIIPLLGSVYNRYRKLILQLKQLSPQWKKIINKVNRTYKLYWKPYSNTEFLSTQIIKGSIDRIKLQEKIQSLDNYQLAKIYNKINYVANCNDVKFYTIRNGKVFIKEELAINVNVQSIEEAKYMIKMMIKNRLNTNLLLIEDSNIDYAFPISEKSFTGDIPFGSIAHFPDGASVIGIAWKNQEKQRVDLDLSVITEDGEKYGWNSYYKSRGNTYIYSGDMTTEGAESFFIQDKKKSLIYVNSYNVTDAQYDIFLAKQEKDEWKKNNHQICDLSKIIFSAKLDLHNESIAGIYDGDKNFIFTNFRGNESNISKSNKYITNNIDALINYAKYSLKLTDIFMTAEEAYEIWRKEEACDLPEQEAEEIFETQNADNFVEITSKADIFNLLKQETMV